jgi:hypothetical protein
MYRQGGYRDLPASQVVSILSGSSVDTGALAGQFNFGLGFDAGVLAELPLGYGFKANFGTAFLDIGDTKFGGTSDPQVGNWSVGAALLYRSMLLDGSLSYEYSHILNPVDPLKRNHLGLEIGLPIIKAYGGVNQVYFTYGVGVDLWIVKIYALSYGEEQATYIRQDPTRRYLFKLDLKFSL